MKTEIEETTTVSSVKEKKVSAKNSPFVSRKDGYSIDPSDIIVDWEDNIRDDYGTPEDEEAFIENIKENGVQQNLKLYIGSDGKWHLYHGYRRMRAILTLKERGHIIEKVNFDQVVKNEEQMLVDHFILNSGKSLNDLESAKALKKLMTMMCTENIADVARRVNLPYQKVFNLLQFEQNAGTAIKQSVAEGEVKFTVAANIVKHSDSVTEQTKILEKARETAKEEGKKNITNKHVPNTKKHTNEPFDIRLNMLLHEADKMDNADVDLINLVREVALAIKRGDSTESMLTFFTL